MSDGMQEPGTEDLTPALFDDSLDYDPELEGLFAGDWALPGLIADGPKHTRSSSPATGVFDRLKAYRRGQSATRIEQMRQGRYPRPADNYRGSFNDLILAESLNRTCRMYTGIIILGWETPIDHAAENISPEHPIDPAS